MSGKLGWLWCWCVLAACSGVGRSVVGERGPAFELDVCPEPLPCEPLDVEEPKAVPAPATPVELAQCTQVGATMCSASATTPATQCSAPAAAFTRTFQSATDLGQLACTTVNIAGAADASELGTGRIELPMWNQVHVESASAVPATLELVGGQIEHVSWVLHGPITLRIVDVPRVNDLRVLADGPVNIEFLRSTGGAVAIDAAQGTLLVRRSSLDHVNVAAQRLDFESSSISDAAWQAASLNAVDTTLERIRSNVERSVLSACDVAKIHFASCQSLTLVQGSFTDARVPACAEETGIYGSAVVNSQLEGDLILDGASLVRVVLGLGEVGSIVTWDTQLTTISVCTDSQELTFGGASDGRCVHCNLTDLPAQPAACRLEEAMPMLEHVASCRSLLGVLPVCGDPQPERMRPPRH